MLVHAWFFCSWYVLGDDVFTLWLFNIAMENHHFLIGKPSINGPFSMTICFKSQRVDLRDGASIESLSVSLVVNHYQHA